MKWCKANNLPALTALIVDEVKGIPNISPTKLFEDEDFPAEQQRVFGYGWYDVKPPSIDDLRIK
jgi:hypothetical protein